jgi:ubiquinone/menaquinone biosynthesis C-methylase UbiE
MNLSEARRHAEAQWTAHPCGAVEGLNTTLDYFLAVERARYLQQAWQHLYFGFDRFAGKRVLEIGIGQGTDLVQFAKGGAECYGIDITDTHLDLARSNFALRGLKAELSKADATAIPYPDAYFDAVYSFGVIHHIPDADKVVREIKRVLKPDGDFMLALYRRWSFFHACVLLRGFLQGKLFRLGYSGLLATIEAGADGKEIKPYVRLYTLHSLRKLLRGFSVQDASVHGLSLGAREKNWMRPALDALTPVLGWYLACRARVAI